MDKLSYYAPTAGRILIGLLFLVAGIGKLGDVQGFAGYLAYGGLPTILAWPSILFEILLGAALIIGFQVRPLALLGAGFCIVTALLYHFDPADQMQMTNFLKNLAIAGGFLFVFATGAGPFALTKK